MRWIRYSHADAAESVYGAGGGGVRRRGGRGGLKLRDKKGLSDAAGLKGQGLGGGCSDLSFGTGGWGGEGLLESLSQVPLEREKEKHVQMESYGVRNICSPVRDC